MKQRVISAVICIAITLAMILLSTWTRIIFFILLSILACREMKDALAKLEYHVVEWPLYAVSIGCSAFIAIEKSGYAFPAFLLIMLLLFTQLILLKNITVKDVLATFAVCAYPLSPLMIITFIAKSDLLWAAVLLNAIMPTVVADTFALFGGKRYGKHKLCPDISPKKTVEGLICGVAMGTVSGFAVYGILKLVGRSVIPLWAVLIASLLACLTGALGDLAASTIKREAGIKDYSNLIPGHGGILDRIDSSLFSLPAVYLLYALFV